MSTPVLRLGILGATNVVQSTYLPILSSLTTYFTLTTIYHTDRDLAAHCQKQFNIPHSTTSPDDLIHHPEVELVLNLLPFDCHEQYTLATLEAGKHVMVDVPLALNIRSLRRIRDARKKGAATHSTTPKVFVGCPRRYAPCFTDVFKKELASLGRIYYARCRNITGPTLSPANTDLARRDPSNGLNVPTTSLRAFLADTFGADEDMSADRAAFCHFLGTMGCHDLSLMRESLGHPDAVSNISIMEPFFAAMFHYTDGSPDNGHPFTLVYEAGIDAVPRCDAHLTIYAERKSLSVQYDFPSPGLAGGPEPTVRVVIEEPEPQPAGLAVGVDVTENGHGVANGSGKSTARACVQRREFVSTATEAYAQEFRAMHAYLVGGETDAGTNEAKTTTDDVLDDLKLLHMIFEHYDRQCGTIRTPLG
ncbi:hypothetical protein N7462_010509 [Penicillium macrosclerotiorum]|uniref:uncharacterized protein n=1 Tax=Penicillium macrosclerotiorum TaxID=303699 RepID=UPI002548136C|nr:uncharacterized protein N7462_010509 [Penicillium macrosclerotiorum]KAJ5669439.1 hypothetical protein N7462_010509 [Penicillium macrosclerotiorum]